MDHPDIPAGLRLPRKKKGSKAEKRTKSNESSKYAPSIRSTASRESAPPEQFYPPPGHAFAAHPSAAPLQSGPAESLGYSWRLHPQEDYAVPERKRTLLSKKNKPLPIRSSSIKNDAQPLQPLPQRSDSRLNTTYPAPPGSPHNSMLLSSVDESLHSKSISQPSTPSWFSRGKEPSVDLNVRVQSPLPALPHQVYGQTERESVKKDEDLALFAAATAGLSPERAGVPNQGRQFAPAEPLRPQASSSSSHIGHLPPSPGRQHSSSSSSARTPSISASSFDNETSSNVGTNQDHGSRKTSNSDLARKTSSPFPPGHPLSRWNTQSSLASSGSGESTHRSSMSGRQPSRSFDAQRPSVPSISVDLPPYQSPRSSNLPSHSEVRSQSQMLTRNPSSSSHTNFSHHVSGNQGRDPSPGPPRSPVSPASPVSSDDDGTSLGRQPWLHENVSALSIDTTVNRTNPNARFSAISSMSAVSDIDPSEISPLDPEDDFDLELELERGPLPDYKTSQEEMAMRRQMENERRAQELQRRWAASTGLG